jgi:putative transferase (TIGR04331 family)
MNNFHKVDYSERFWKIYSIVWLSQWLGVCYDRYQRLNYLQKITDEKLTVKILDNRKCFVKDGADYSKKITEGHYYNLLLMSDIIRNGKFNFLVPQVSDISEDNIDKEKENDIQESVKGHCFRTVLLEKIKLLVKTRIIPFKNCFPVYLGTIYGLSILDTCYLGFYYAPLAIFTRKTTSKLPPIEGDRSNFINYHLDFTAENEFEEIVKEIILQHVPETFFTLHPPLEASNSKIMAWIGNDIYSSEKNAFRIAEICERGGLWISSQIGGGFGQTLSFPFAKIDYQTSDGFITWGWNYNHVYPAKIYPLPSPLLSKLGKHRQKNDTLIFVSTSQPSYYYRLLSILPEQLLEYMSNQIAFLRELSNKIRTKIKYKPALYEFGTESRAFINKVIPWGQFMLGGMLTNEMQKCKLIVVDHVATTSLQAFAMNAPIILFWNPAHFALTPQAVPYFDKLRSAGILFDNPQDAAKKVNEIWHDVQGWWQQPEVQNAKDEFCHQFARTSKNWRKEWSEFLKQLNRKQLNG